MLTISKEILDFSQCLFYSAQGLLSDIQFLTKMTPEYLNLIREKIEALEKEIDEDNDIDGTTARQLKLHTQRILGFIDGILAGEDK